MNTIYFLKGTNVEVINFYFSIVQKAFEQNNWKVSYIQDLKDTLKLKKTDFIFIAECSDFVRLTLKGYKNLIFWSQGVVPEEDYLRKKSHIRKLLLSVCEKIALKKSKMLFLVSNRMKEHYEKKYHLNLSKAIIIPCFNTEFDEKIFERKNYKKNTFCYVGSMAKWQYFDKTVEVYQEIEKKLNGNSFFKIFTPQKEEAQIIVNKYNIANYSIEYVKQDKLLEKLIECKFGFILRENNIINNVATPTKMSSYLSSGIIPIYSECIESFHSNLSNYKYALPLSESLDIKKILTLCSDTIDYNDIKEENKKIFNSYYNTDKYINQIASKIKFL